MHLEGSHELSLTYGHITSTFLSQRRPAAPCLCALHRRIHCPKNFQFLLKPKYHRLVWECWPLFLLSSTDFIFWILSFITPCLIGPNLNIRTIISGTCSCDWWIFIFYWRV